MEVMTLSYNVARLPVAGEEASVFDTLWSNRVWDLVESIQLDWFHPASSDHRPRTQVRMLHGPRDLLVRFDVDDQYVLSTATRFQQSVCLDSCVEFFFRPDAARGYFNLEINCGGTMLMSYIQDPRRTEAGFSKWMPVSWDDARKIQIFHSLPKVVIPERQEPTAWRIGCRIPLETLEPYVGPIQTLSGQTWTGNFYKCADRSSHPHWASWAPLGQMLNFHQPDHFGAISFDP
jgi:hypothetical protein